MRNRPLRILQSQPYSRGSDASLLRCRRRRRSCRPAGELAGQGPTARVLGPDRRRGAGRQATALPAADSAADAVRARSAAQRGHPRPLVRQPRRRAGAARQDHDGARALGHAARGRLLGDHPRERLPARRRPRVRREPGADRQRGRSPRCNCAGSRTSSRPTRTFEVLVWADSVRTVETHGRRSRRRTSARTPGRSTYWWRSAALGGRTGARDAETALAVGDGDRRLRRRCDSPGSPGTKARSAHGVDEAELEHVRVVPPRPGRDPHQPADAGPVRRGRRTGGQRRRQPVLRAGRPRCSRRSATNGARVVLRSGAYITHDDGLSPALAAR